MTKKKKKRKQDSRLKKLYIECQNILFKIIIILHLKLFMEQKQ